MNGKDTAEKWGVKAKKVYQYCHPGLIRFAYKETNFPFSWVIPDISKPPADPNEFLILLNIIQSIREVAIINFDNIGIGEEVATKSYKYLSDNGFITFFDDTAPNINLALQNIRITSSGAEILSKDAEPGAKKSKTTISGEVQVNAGIATAKVAAERTAERE